MHPYLSRPLLLWSHGDREGSGASGKRRKISRVREDFTCLLDRIDRRLYPETIPVLASYWLKTVYWNGYTRDEWRELDKLLKKQLQASGSLSEPARQAFADIRAWIKESGRPPETAPAPRKTASLTRRPALNPEALVAYAVRLLNEWLPQEVARILIQEPEPGVPALVVGRALERLLLRDRLSFSTLEALLDPKLLSARMAYPADVEMLRDVVLYLLGRTEAPVPVLLPAFLVAVAPDARLFPGYACEVEKGYVVGRSDGDELHVPVSADQVKHILAEPVARIGSIVVTGDGRCWEAERLEEGGPNLIVYKPHARLGLDYSRDHVRLRLPWPDTRRSWAGASGVPVFLELFGRRWRTAAWERDSVRTWRHLVYSGILPTQAGAPKSATALRRSGPASADLAWAELATALAAALARNEWEPIENLQREDLLPLARALFGFTQALRNRRERTAEAIESHLQRIQFLHAGLVSAYGPIPWRILPNLLRNALLRQRRDSTHIREMLESGFTGLPAEPENPPAPRPLVRAAGQDPFSF